MLVRETEHLLTRQAGRPSHIPKAFYHRHRNQAKSWRCERWSVAKVDWHAVEPCLRVGFIVTNRPQYPTNVPEVDNRRRTAQQWLNDGKNAAKGTKLSRPTFEDNPARLQRFAPAYRPANFQRRLALPGNLQHQSLTTLREKLVQFVARMTRHPKYVTYQRAEMTVPRR
ncbi:MAG: transposase [Pirellulales bacterium]|nr:transposase [Pirellulales bacterium]